MWSTGINRNIVECKATMEIYHRRHMWVLIETLWNVKTKKLNTSKVGKTVLIETLWNVKQDRMDLTCQTTRINRNIVECKGTISSGTIRALPGINRNIVECKVEVYNVADLVRLRINRNIVECKA